MPDFLQDYGKMLSYFNQIMEPLSSVEKGSKFADLALKIIELSDEIGEFFEAPELSAKMSHDKGVDATAKHRENQTLLRIQSKYSINGVDDFDAIISKFESFEVFINKKTETSLFPLESEKLDNFAIVTISDINGILKKYQASNRPSTLFYEKLLKGNRIFIKQGSDILRILQDTYRKLYVLPTNVELLSSKNFINFENVWVGFVGTDEIIRIYKQFGDALFWENIREYLGEDSGKTASELRGAETVNRAILYTLQNEPSKFLSRNNGITIRAKKIEPINDNKVNLIEASIVNGCQTTISIVKTGAIGGHVLVKIVEAEDSWDIAKSANFQNSIKQLDLEIAKYVRPQLVRKTVSEDGIVFEDDYESPFSVIEKIYTERTNYKEIRTLFLGLCSNDPSNCLRANYINLHYSLLESLYKSEQDFNSIFETLSMLSRQTFVISETIAQRMKNTGTMGELFKRFWHEDRSKSAGYRAYISLLAVCGAVGENIFENNQNREQDKLMKFMSSVTELVTSKKDTLKKYYFDAFKIIAFDTMRSESEKDKIVQQMYDKITKANFDILYEKLKMNEIEI